MSVRKTIFGSHSERELFVSIDSYWSTRGFALYPSLPFASIFDITKLNVTPEEKNFLFKTNVDYTLCTKEGQPVISVEFDGVSHGFSRHGRYVALRPAPHNDPRRAWKLDVKLRLATEADYPLLVVSYHEKNPVAEDSHMTILDGMIGRVLAKREFSRRLQPMVDEHATILAEMSRDEVNAYLDYLCVDLEVELALHWNPIARAAADKMMELLERGISSSDGMRFLEPPGIPAYPRVGEPNFAEALEARAQALRRSIWVGCEFTYETIHGVVSAQGWVRDIEHAGVSSYGLAEDIAGLLAAHQALKLADQEHARP